MRGIGSRWRDGDKRVVLWSLRKGAISCRSIADGEIAVHSIEEFSKLFTFVAKPIAVGDTVVCVRPLDGIAPGVYNVAQAHQPDRIYLLGVDHPFSAARFWLPEPEVVVKPEPSETELRRRRQTSMLTAELDRPLPTRR